MRWRLACYGGALDKFSLGPHFPPLLRVPVDSHPIDTSRSLQQGSNQVPMAPCANTFPSPVPSPEPCPSSTDLGAEFTPSKLLQDYGVSRGTAYGQVQMPQICTYRS